MQTPSHTSLPFKCSHLHTAGADTDSPSWAFAIPAKALHRWIALLFVVTAFASLDMRSLAQCPCQGMGELGDNWVVVPGRIRVLPEMTNVITILVYRTDGAQRLESTIIVTNNAGTGGIATFRLARDGQYRFVPDPPYEGCEEVEPDHFICFTMAYLGIDFADPLDCDGNRRPSSWSSGATRASDGVLPSAGGGLPALPGLPGSPDAAGRGKPAVLVDNQPYQPYTYALFEYEGEGASADTVSTNQEVVLDNGDDDEECSDAESGGGGGLPIADSSMPGRHTPSASSAAMKIGLGSGAGAMRFHEQTLGNAAFRPYALHYRMPFNMRHLQGGAVSYATFVEAGETNYYPSEITTPDVYAKVVWDPTNAPNYYSIEFRDNHLPAQPLFAEIRVTNDAGNLKIVELRSNAVAGALTGVSTSVFVHVASTNSWQLQKSGGIRWIKNSSAGAVAHTTNYATTIEGPEGILGKFSETYLYSTNLCPLLIDRVDYLDAAHTVSSTYAYYTNAGDVGSMYYGQLKSWSDSVGMWQERVYNTNGLLVTLARPWLDGGQTSGTRRVTHYEYGSTAAGTRPVAIAEYVLTASSSNSIGRQEFSFTEFATNGLYGMTALEQTVRRLDGQGGEVTNMTVIAGPSGDDVPLWLKGRPLLSRGVDGTQMTYSYNVGTYRGSDDVFAESSTGTALSVTTTHGTEDSPVGIAYKTTRNVRIIDENGRLAAQETWIRTDAGSGNFAKVSDLRYNYDREGNLTNRLENGVEMYAAGYDAGLRSWEKGTDGVTVRFQYDAVGRVSVSARDPVAASGSYAAQSAVSNLFFYNATGFLTQQITKAGSIALTNVTAHDWLGRVLYQRTEGGLVTTNAWHADGLHVTSWLPGGGTRTFEHYLDGHLKAMTGSVETATFYSYNLAGDGFVTETVARGATNSVNYSTARRDWLGRTIITLTPSPAGGTMAVTNYYNGLGQLMRSTRPSPLAAVAYAYDELGRRSFTGVDLNGDGSVPTESAEPLQQTGSSFVQFGDAWWQVSTQAIYTTSGAGGTPITTSQSWQGFMTNVAGKARTISLHVDVSGNVTTNVVEIDRANLTRTEKTYRPGVANPEVQEYYAGRLQKTTMADGRTVNYSYDTLGRPTDVVDSDTGHRVTHYDAFGRVDYVEDAYTNRTSYGFDSAGRIVSATNAMGQTTFYNYDIRGQQTNIWGSAVYPVQYEFDDFGRMVALTTFRGGATWSSAEWPGAGVSGDTTTWHYGPTSGALTNKVYANGKGPSYTYTAAGQIAVRKWARDVTTEYGYDGAGRLTNVVYSDGTPGVSYDEYFRHGAPYMVSDASGQRVFGYDTRLLPQDEVLNWLASTPFPTTTLTKLFETEGPVLGRPTGLTVDPGATAFVLGYGYDDLGRLNRVSSGSYTGRYAYATNSSWRTTTRHGFDGKTVMATTLTRNHGGQIVAVKNQPLFDQAVAFGYQYDEAGRRIQMSTDVEALESVWHYGYNTRGEVTNGVRVWASDQAEVAGQKFAYLFDPIGNRTASRRGDDTEMVWQANELNQYTNRQVSDQLHLVGVASTQADWVVTVNSQNVVRQGAYFHGTLTVTNAGTSVWKTVTVQVTDTNAVVQAQEDGALFVAESPEKFGYDADGNLTNDARWLYYWDAENRLTQMVTRTSAAAVGTTNRLLAFGYDYMSRRIAKRVYVVQDEATNLVESRFFIYDGWNLLQDRVVFSTQGDTATNSYVWGLDLSGTLQGAGGVGGLLAAFRRGDPEPVEGWTCYGFDANGNVAILIGTNGQTVATYEYAPFGERLRSSGTLAATDPFQFSTKYCDEESGLLYYGHRHFNPQLGRWLTRDPKGEQNCIDLYGFCANDAVNQVDLVGLLTIVGNGDMSNGGAYTVNSDGLYAGFHICIDATHFLVYSLSMSYNVKPCDCNDWVTGKTPQYNIMPGTRADQQSWTSADGKTKCYYVNPLNTGALVAGVRDNRFGRVIDNKEHVYQNSQGSITITMNIGEYSGTYNLPENAGGTPPRGAIWHDFYSRNGRWWPRATRSGQSTSPTLIAASHVIINAEWKHCDGSNEESIDFVPQLPGGPSRQYQ